MKDLLAIPGIGPVLKSTWFWRLARMALLGLLLAMIAYGWHQHDIPGVSVADPLMYTNLATFGLWVLWMMGVVFLALFFGRLWCSFCPLGWLSGVFYPHLPADMQTAEPQAGWLEFHRANSKLGFI